MLSQKRNTKEERHTKSDCHFFQKGSLKREDSKISFNITQQGAWSDRSLWMHRNSFAREKDGKKESIEWSTEIGGSLEEHGRSIQDKWGSWEWNWCVSRNSQTWEKSRIAIQTTEECQLLTQNHIDKRLEYYHEQLRNRNIHKWTRSTLFPNRQ